MKAEALRRRGRVGSPVGSILVGLGAAVQPGRRRRPSLFTGIWETTEARYRPTALLLFLSPNMFYFQKINQTSWKQLLHLNKISATKRFAEKLFFHG